MYSAMEDLKQEWMQYIRKEYEKEIDKYKKKLEEIENENKAENEKMKLDLAENCIRSGEVNPEKILELFEFTPQEVQELQKRMEK